MTSKPIVLVCGAIALLAGVVTTVQPAKADYGCVQEPSTNSTTGPYICLDKPTTSNIWKSPDELNATGKLHGSGPIYAFMNETVTFTPTSECKRENIALNNASAISDPMFSAITEKCVDSVFEWNQMHPENLIIEK
jgi:hypothetical protein